MTPINQKTGSHPLDALVNNFVGFIYTISRDCRIEFMNKTLKDHIGYDGTGADCFRVIHGLPERCPWCMADTVLAGETANFEFKSPKDDRWYYYISTPRKDASGRITGQQLMAIDIHERKLARDSLEQENLLLKSAAVNRYGLGDIVGQSRQMQAVYNLILEVASSDAGVLICGESGTGKELAAKAIHDLGKRKDQPFLPVNCGGIPETLIESEFFGYKKGAFTGAHLDKSGFLETADKGTLFLDEIGEIHLNMQVKLLRALDGDGYTPLGSHLPVRPDIRIIAATNRDLEDLVDKGTMRSDFFYRINVVPIHLPPLRERREDIPLLIYHFLQRFSTSPTLPHIPPAVMSALENYGWPGNVRELQNIIHRYIALNRLDVFDAFFSRKNGTGQVHEPGIGDASLSRAVHAFEKKLIIQALENHGWKQGQVAAYLGMNRKTLYSKIKKYQIVKS